MEIKNTDWKVIKFNSIINPILLYEEVPEERGKVTYNKYGNIVDTSEEKQVSGSLSRYNYKPYKPIHYALKEKIENKIQEKLYPSYYYDRFYFKDQELKKHIDRGACEISLSVHVSSNLDYKWPLYFQHEDKIIEVICNPGDAVLYKGCEVLHWRDPMIGDEDTYFHQVFFHYVRANGHYLQYAYDNAVDIY
jgi:hypothetical protein